jgi:hypothetical protein
MPKRAWRHQSTRACASVAMAVSCASDAHSVNSKALISLAVRFSLEFTFSSLRVVINRRIVRSARRARNCKIHQGGQ